MVTAAAIKFYILGDKYPTIMCGKRHADILGKMYDLHIQYDRNTAVQGFLTDANSFVDRYEAFQIALVYDQLLPEAKVEYGGKTVAQLFSEDVW